LRLRDIVTQETHYVLLQHGVIYFVVVFDIEKIPRQPHQKVAFVRRIHALPKMIFPISADPLFPIHIGTLNYSKVNEQRLLLAFDGGVHFI
jgi:hypothetical protein